MLLAANCWTASMTILSSSIRKSMLLYPLSLAASAAVVMEPVDKALLAGATREVERAVRATIGAILDNMVRGVF